MTEQKHTPGPLVADGPFIRSADGLLLGTTNCTLRTVSEAEAHANAMLWAAAPELLAACKVAESAIDLSIDAEELKPSEAWAGILGTIRAAIAKVEGVEPATKRKDQP